MLNISDTLKYYIEVKFTPEVKGVIYECFSVMELFSLKYYEDKYLNLIGKEDTIDVNDKLDNFILMLENDLRSIIEDHGITLEEKHIDLFSLKEICHGLFLISILEDYSLVEHILTSYLDSRGVVIELLKHYTLLEEYELKEMIIEVDDNLINALMLLIKDKIEVFDEDYLRQKHEKYLKWFFDFTEKTRSIGYLLYEKGYRQLSLMEICELIPYDLKSYLENKAKSSIAEVALDILSILILAKDSYEMPLFVFQKDPSVFINDTELVSRVYHILMRMLEDFNEYCTVRKLEEKESKLNQS